MNRNQELARIITGLVAMVSEHHTEGRTAEEAQILFDAGEAVQELNASEAVSYLLMGPDGIPDHPGSYQTVDQVARAAAAFVLRFVKQGYYRDIRMQKQPLEWIVANLRVDTLEQKMTPSQAYVNYVNDNLERIASDGWVPLCYEEFLGSEECENLVDPDVEESVPMPPLPDDSEWEFVGEVGVDSGQLMISDPCYLRSEWKGEDEQTPLPAEAQIHEDGTVLYCALHGAPPVPGAVPFGNWEEVIDKYGKTPNQLREEGKLKTRRDFSAPGEFSYSGCCHRTLGDRQVGQLNYRRGHAGAGVVSTTGYGDGCYPVYARRVDTGMMGERIAELRVVMLQDDEIDDDDFEAPAYEDVDELDFLDPRGMAPKQALAEGTGTQPEDWLESESYPGDGCVAQEFTHKESGQRAKTETSHDGCRVMLTGDGVCEFLRKYDKRREAIQG